MKTATGAPWFRFESSDAAFERPFDGLMFAQWELGESRLEVTYDGGTWFFDDGAECIRCRSLARAMRLFWRAVKRLA